ncbi:methyl-accepting chemotaxis protein [Anaerocolumna xylanovorans]|uniref:Methyl-accepting chemotaxis protein n=1 Tax=Anaerocolumna xylanovorans DSM 12503 TaxID=1121345 RepID=A0A1M7YLZ0_9FIRM|nr:methyl-accepting chemotaxis protein [Anaerocolumna xylanovorans]SHO53607.1 methyl-accepting chemotaxis protein [Anaerocolumna xylanovorans DSM 12503]
MKKQDTYDYKRVDVVNLIITIALVILLCIQNVITYGIAGSITSLLSGALILVISFINYLVPIKQNVKALIFSILPALVITALMYTDKFEVNNHYILILTIAMVGLYFKKELIVIHGIFLNVALNLVYVLNHEGVMGMDTGTGSYVKILLLMNGILVLLFFLAKWGNEVVGKANEKETEARKLLETLEITFQAMEKGSKSLDTNVSTVNTQLYGISTASKDILNSVQQMAAAIQEEATGVYRVNESMITSMQVMNQSIDISKGVVAKSSDMANKVEDGWNKIHEVSNHMNTATTAIGMTAATVNELKDSLGEINTLLNGIKTIAGQTNLLALNASIESARAGEQGKGFAVVAEQIRALSEQSKGIVANINDVTESIFTKSELASKMSVEGEKATTDGISIIQEVAEYFTDIRNSYIETNSALSKNMNQIAAAAKDFTEIQEQITHMASIAEENSASTQEIFSIIEDENSQINGINSSVQEVTNLSKVLKELSVR